MKNSERANTRLKPKFPRIKLLLQRRAQAEAIA